MLIPSIDLQGGRIVQLVQGERLAVASTDVDGWVARFAGFPAVQLIDLDAARSEGSNDGLVRRICSRLPCRVGGGIRSAEAARRVVDAGATHVIAGSALFHEDSVDTAAAERLAAAVGAERLIAAIDSRGGRVVTHGWRSQTSITPVDAARLLEPFVSELLFTIVDREGLMQGTDVDAILAVRAATRRRVTAAGGITTSDEIDRLHDLGVDAVVGMAIYTGRLAVPPPPSR